MQYRIAAAVWSTVVTMSLVFHEKHREHWWWDNVAHFLGGFGLGMLYPDGQEHRLFLVTAAVWEAFEYWLARQKLYETYDWAPKGPRSLGYEEWSFDHQAEDTLLDTVMGYYGAKTAQRLKDLR